MSNKKIYMIFIVLFILLIALSTATATENTTTDTIKKTEHNNEITSKTPTKTETNTIKTNTTAKTTTNSNTDTTTESNSNKELSKNIKSNSVKESPELLPVSFNIENKNAVRGDIINYTYTSNPDNLEDGLISWFVDNNLKAVNNLSKTEGTFLNYDTSELSLGVHEIMLDYGESSTYDNNYTTAYLTIYENTTVNADKTNLLGSTMDYASYTSIKLTSDNVSACGDILVYVDDTLVNTISDTVWNNTVISFSKSYGVGNHTWKVSFSNNKYYVANDITGSLELVDRVDLTVNPVVCNYNEIVEIPVLVNPNITEGVLTLYVNDMFADVLNLSISEPVFNYRADYYSGEYELMVSYSASLNYPNSVTTSTITINAQNSSITDFSTSYDNNNDISVSMNIMGSDGELLDWGYLSVYQGNQHIKTVEINELPAVFTLDKQYNGKILRFEYDGDDNYNGCTKEELINLEKLNVTISSSSSITANVGDAVTIPLTFNDTVSDGKVSVSYGGSPDNIIDITSGTDSITFDTTDYLQGEYELVLRYYDSRVYNENTTTLTLYLYQPTSITADEDEINVTLGKGNEYPIEFTTSLDSWNDVIWGSIDVYVDNTIIDTIIVDDETGNHGSIVLDDYNLEDLTPGTHTLRAEFTTDDPYINSSSVDVILNVSGDVIIEFPENVTLMINEDTYIVANVTFNGKRITEGKIKYEAPNVSSNFLPLSGFYINGAHIKASVNEGIYDITFNYHDDNGVYPDANLTSKLIVRTNTNITIGTTNNKTYDTTMYIILRNDRGVSITRYVNITLPNGTRLENYLVNSIVNMPLDLIPAGEYTVTVETPEELLYKNATKEYVFTITRDDSHIAAGTLSDYAEIVRFTSKVTRNNTNTPATSGIVEVINLANNEVIGTATVGENGFANSNLSIDTPGEYQLRFDFKGNEYLEPSSKYLNITVLKRPTTTTLSIISKTYNDTSIKVTVKDKQLRETLLNAPIIITISDGTTISTDTGSTGTVTVPFTIAAGTHNITVEYTGTDLLNVSNITREITVTQGQSTTTAIVTNASVRNVTVNVTVTDKTSGAIIPNGQVEILDNNGNTVGTGNIDSTGKATITTTINSKDITELTVNYLGNTNYTGSTYTINDLVVVGRLSDIELTEENLTYGNISLNITVKDPVTDTPIPNAPIKITYPNGTIVETTTDSNGNITINPDLPVGTNTVTVEFTGNDDYNTTTEDYTFSVTMRESSTIATVTNATVRNTTVIVTVTDKTTGEAVTSGDIEVIDTSTGLVIGRATITDGNPVSITTNIENTGTYNLRVDFKGNTNYTGSSYSLDNVVVSKRASQTIVETVNDVYNSTSIRVTVKDPVTDTPITNALVTVTLPNGTTININTGSTGTVDVAVDLPVGSNTLTVEFSGDNDYNSSDDSITVNVQKRSSTTTATITNATVRNTTITVTVTDTVNNNPVTTGTIEVIDTNTGSTIGSATLTESNTATIATNIALQGEYDLLVRYNGNDYYNSSSTTLDDVTVTGRISSIENTVNNQTTGNISINIQAIDPITDTPIPNAEIIITYPDGTTETVTTDNNGNYTITHDLPVGTNTITVELVANDDYNSTTSSITVNVDKRESITTATLTNNTIGNTTINIRVTDKTTGTSVTSGEIEVINAANNAVIARGTLNSEDINITADINTIGTYNLIVRYDGNTNYYGSQDTLDDVTIEKRASTILVTTVDDIINNTQITITVKDPVTGETITNAPISITLANGQVINTHTGSTGTITQTLTLPAGENTITVDYSGSNTYNTSTATHTLDVQKLASTITLTRMTAYIGNTITLTARVNDINGTALTGGRLVFKLNDVTLKDNNGEVIYATVEDGIASITYNIPANYQAKTYKLTAVYEGNNDHNGTRSSAVLLNLKQRQAKLTLSCSDTVSVSDSINFHVTITDKQDSTRNINGFVIFKIDGKTLKDNNGNNIEVPITSNTVDYAFTVTSDYSARKHTVTVVLGNGSYVRSQAENTFNVTQAATRLTVNKPNLSSSNVKLTGTITDSDDQPVSGINKVAVKVDGVTLKDETGENILFLVNNGNIDIDLPINPTDYTKDSYNVEVVTGERSAYTGARTSTVMTREDTTSTSEDNSTPLTKLTSTELKTSTTSKEFVNIITTEQITTTEASNEIEINVLDIYNKQVKKGTVTFKQSGKTLNTTKVTNGIAKLNYKFTRAGTYNIEAIYTDTSGTYIDTTKTFQVTVVDTKTGVNIVATNTNSVIGDTITYTTHLLDNYGNKINTGTVTTTINGKTQTNKVTNGESTATITLSSAGKYSITSKYNSNKYYPTAQVTRTITVNKKTPTVTVSAINAMAGTTTNITVTVKTQEGTPLDGKVQLRLNNTNTVKTANVVDGKCVISYKIPIDWATNKITTQITYKDNNYYNNKTVSKDFTVSKKTTSTSITKPKTTMYLDNITITGTLKDKDGNKLVKTPVTIYINKEKKTVTTDNNGAYKVTSQAKTVGTNNITVTYNGNNKYASSTSKTTVTVTKRSTKITNNNITTKSYTDNVTITGKLTDKNNKALANTTVVLTVNNAKKTLKTDSKGIFRHIVKASRIGTNNVTVTYAGNTKYSKVTAKTTFKVTPKTTKITITKIAKTKLGKTVTITGKCTDTSGRKLVSTTVKVIVNSVKYTVKTKSNGVYTLKYKTSKVGTNNITVSYPGNSKYLSSSIKTTFKVVKT